MAVVDVLRWISGSGWIVLSGGADSDVRAMALHRAKAHGGVAYIGFNENSADDILDDMDDLGAPTGYLVNILEEDDDTIRWQIGDASVIVIDNSVDAETWRSSLTGAAMDALVEAVGRGAVILAEGTGAAALGDLILTDNTLGAGLGWLENALVLPDTASLAESDVARVVLETTPSAIAVGIGVGAALVLGPDGQIETWGNRQVAIALGRDYQQTTED